MSMSFTRLPSRRRFALGDPGASAEREADRIADQATVAHQPSDKPRETSAASLDGSPDPSGLEDLLPAPGHPLDPAARARLEPRFQFDFSRVRVHHDEAAGLAAAGLSARAFTLGPHIGFGQGEYAPETPDGLRLIAHELAHVVQHTRDAFPIVRRDSKLKGKVNQLFGEGDAPEVDKAIADSPIAKYLDKKNLKTLKGNVDMQRPDVFAGQAKEIVASGENVDEVPGFVDRGAKQPIKLRLPGTVEKQGKQQLVVAATYEAAVHETIHLNSSTKFQHDFGHNLNEGVTQHFTEVVLGASGKAYSENLKMAETLISLLTEDVVARAYFQGDSEAFDKVRHAFDRDNQSRLDFQAWQRARDKKPPDWEAANRILTDAFHATKQPGATSAPPQSRNVPATTPRP
jgi:hypothetical protein